MIVDIFSRVGVIGGLLLIGVCAVFGAPEIKIGDVDVDEAATVLDLVIINDHLQGISTLPVELEFVADVNQDGSITDTDVDLLVDAILEMIALPDAELTELSDTSPEDGEGDVAVTRETVLRFSKPLAVGTEIDENNLFAEFGGERLDADVHIAQDRRTVTLFYGEMLPSSSRIRVTLIGGDIADELGLSVDVDTDGVPGGTYEFDFDTVSLSVIPGTAVCGRIFDSEQVDSGGGMFVNPPLEGVTITIDGMEEELSVVTDADGNFRLEPVPGGEFFVHINGKTVVDLAEGIRYPDMAYYPNVGKKWEAVAGQETNLEDIFLPLIPDDTLQPASATVETVLEFSEDFVTANPKFDGVAITLPPDSLLDPGNIGTGMVGIARVDPDRLPGQLPAGLGIQDVITIQTDGAENFDGTVSACFPNLDDPMTGQPLPPLTKSALWSFNHDTGRFEVVGSATVTADGQLVCTDEGVGIPAPGWHGTARGSTGSRGPITRGGRSGTGQEPPNCDQPRDRTDPVYLYSGEFYDSVVDLRIKGRGTDFVWSRKYRSKIGPMTRQGNQWDCSYNLLIMPEGGDLVLFDGNTRQDVYERQGDETYVAVGFFREIAQNLDGTYSLLFEDRREWIFNALDGSAAAGYIAAIIDRNGNAINFEYAQDGRLDRIIDTLDRDILISHNADGFISEITDFANRTVSYEYYDGGEAGGAFGDLKSVTTPFVTGTPNGNDFPNGKTTTYTYSSGFEDDRLNHNLLTITDGRRNDINDPTFGTGAYLVNVYAATTDPDDPLFDRVVRQIWGGDTLDISYVSIFPSRANNDAVMRTIVNDRNGNVVEYFYDSNNRMVRQREFTGRADPTVPTTEIANRPGNQLRPADPNFFETIYEWNEDSLRTRVTHPNGNVTEYVYEQDLNPDAPARSRGNLKTMRRLPGSHLPAGDQESIEISYEYDTEFSGCCGFNFVTRHLDGKGNETLYEYDLFGNRTQIQQRISTVVDNFEYKEFGQMTSHIWPDNGSGHRRRDDYFYYDSGPQRGYVSQEVIDPGNLVLTTNYEYDAVGNPVRVIDPRGNDVQYIHNALDQVVREFSREVADASGIRYERDTFFDANNNVTRIDVNNIDDAGSLQANTHFTNTFEYEILNNRVRLEEEVDSSNSIVTLYEYDANRNQTRILLGESTNGNQTANTFTLLYDERDLLFQEIRAEGDPGQSTTQYDYDRNGNQVQTSVGIESNPRNSTYLFDGYDRIVSRTDPNGNVLSYNYDPNDNFTRELFDGELVDVLGNAGNARLREVTNVYDDLDRHIRLETEFFDTDTQNPIGDGISILQTDYSDNSQVVRVLNDNNHERFFTYDRANRKSVETDAKGNTITSSYDANSNLISVVEVEKSDLGNSDETFTTDFTYDNLDRLIKSVDNVGNTNEYAYDSRSNRTLVSDALRTQANLPGNLTRFEFDGLNRMTRTTRFLTDDGTGSGNANGTIETMKIWDASSRLTGMTDDNGNTTTYFYDALNRKVAGNYQDGTSHTYTFDVHNNRTQMVDANGSTVTSTYDLLNRITQKTINPGGGVSNDTTFEIFQYDGLSRLVRAEDDDSVVTQSYDSRSMLVRETLNGETTLMSHDGVSNLLSTTYPGGRVVDFTYDTLERKDMISDAGGLITDYEYIGPGRVEVRQLGNNTESGYEYDGVKRITRTLHTLDPGGAGPVFDDRAYTYDTMFNKTSRADGLAGGITHDYSYDSIYRLAQTDATPSGGPTATTNYSFDGVANRTSVTGGPRPGAYTQDPTLADPGDFQVNQYTSTAFDARTYDPNGNLSIIDDSQPSERNFSYDYRNRMVSDTDTSTGITTNYAYDALGRRIERVVDAGGASPETTRYFYSGFQVCEEQDENNATLATYVYGRYLDEVVRMDRNGGEFYFHSDELFNVMKVTDATGATVERYDYDDYGEPSFFDGGGTPIGATGIGNPYLFTGRRYDAETGFYYFRFRYLDPVSGRFTIRDPIGVWTDNLNTGNGYAYASSNPQTVLDMYGLWSLGRFILTGDGNAEDNVYDAARTQFQETLWDRTNATVSTLSGGHADANTVTGVFMPDSWGVETNETAHVFDALEQAKAACFARCWALKTGDAIVGTFIPIPVSPVSGVAGMANGEGPGGFVDTDAADWGSSAGRNRAGRAGADVDRLRSARNLVNRAQVRDMFSDTSRHLAGGSTHRGPSEAAIRRRLESAGRINGELRNASRNLRRLEAAGKGLAALALIQEMKRCYDECEKDPCSH